MTTAKEIDPILNVSDPRFLREPYNYRFIVDKDPKRNGQYTATTFEMPNVAATAEASHEALNLLALHLALDMPAEMLAPSSRHNGLSVQERNRFLPVQERCLNAGVLEIPGTEHLKIRRREDDWVTFDPYEEMQEQLANTIDELDVSLWLHPAEGPTQLTQIYAEVYGNSSTPEKERRWPNHQVENAVGHNPDDDSQHPEEDDYFTVVFEGHRARAICTGSTDRIPNLVQVREIFPKEGHTEEEFWQRLRANTHAEANATAVCQECGRERAQYSCQPQQTEPGDEPESLRLCAHCTVDFLWELSVSQPTLTRLTIMERRWNSTTIS